MRGEDLAFGAHNVLWLAPDGEGYHFLSLVFLPLRPPWELEQHKEVGLNHLCCFPHQPTWNQYAILAARTEITHRFYQELLKEKSNPQLKGNRKGIIVKDKEFYIPILNTFPTR